MGLIANYKYLSDKNLNELKSLYTENTASITDIEEHNNDLEILLDLDKMWDALHFLLTGKSAAEPIEEDLISEAIVGQDSLTDEEVEEFIAGIRADRVKEIAKALEALDFESYLDKFEMTHFAQNDIYPNIWSYEEEIDEIKEDLSYAFDSLKAFYTRMAEKGCAVIVSIY